MMRVMMEEGRIDAKWESVVNDVESEIARRIGVARIAMKPIMLLRGLGYTGQQIGDAMRHLGENTK